MSLLLYSASSRSLVMNAGSGVKMLVHLPRSRGYGVKHFQSSNCHLIVLLDRLKESHAPPHRARRVLVDTAALELFFSGNGHCCRE